MKPTCVAVANQSGARFFRLPSPRGALELLDELHHDEGREHERDFNADRPGRSFDREGPARHAMGKAHSPREQAAIRFAHSVSAWLAPRFYQHDFERLVLCAPPRFLGLLRDYLPKEVQSAIVLSLDKDLAAIADSGEIRQHLPERI